MEELWGGNFTDDQGWKAGLIPGPVLNTLQDVVGYVAGYQDPRVFRFRNLPYTYGTGLTYEQAKAESGKIRQWHGDVMSEPDPAPIEIMPRSDRKSVV